MPGISRHAAGRDDTPVTAAPGLRSSAEDRWRDAARAAGKRADLEGIRAIGPELAGRESWLPGSALRQVAAGLPGGGRALVAGHSPATEAAVPGLAGRVVPPLGQGKGVLLVEDGGSGREPGARLITEVTLSLAACGRIAEYALLAHSMPGIASSVQINHSGVLPGDPAALVSGWSAGGQQQSG